jgi:hypothetical protein
MSDEKKSKYRGTLVPMSEVPEELRDPAPEESELDRFHAEMRLKPRPPLEGLDLPGAVILVWDPPINKGSVGMHFDTAAEANDWYCSNLAPMSGWPIHARLVPQEGFVSPEGLFSFVDEFK